MALSVGSCSSSPSSRASKTSTPTATVAPRPVPKTAKLQQILDGWMTRNITPGAVLAVQVGDHTPVIVVAGDADRHRHTPLRADDEFRIGSVTKAFVGETARALIDRHALALDATIDRWFPDFPNANRITVEDLMRHRSGLPPVGDDAGPSIYDSVYTQWIAARLSTHLTPDDVITFVKNRPLLSRPGTATHYSNLNFILLGEIAAKIDHTDVAHAIRREVLTPLHLNNTYFAATERGRAPVPGIQHIEANPTPVDENAFPDTGTVSALGAAGAMIATPADLLSWSKQYFRAQARGEQDLANSPFKIEATGAGLGALGFATNGFCIFYGCGRHPTFIGIGADGEVPGGSAQVMYNSGDDFTIVTLANADHVNLEDLTARVDYLIHAGATRYDKAFPRSSARP
jgi:D-alanyl-D-alanine carboxypeptidase